MQFQHMRIARPVQSLAQSCEMYCLGLGFSKIGEFQDHQGFSGVMLGHKDLSWHLEFTQCNVHPIKPQHTVDDLLVLYIPNLIDWQSTCQKMLSAGFEVIQSLNSYWELNGRTFVDQDGYRTVLQNQQWG